MEVNTLPKDVSELKNFVLKVIGETSERVVPYVSLDEQKELEGLYGDSLHEEYDSKDAVKL